LVLKNSYKEKAAEATKPKEEKRENPKPEEHEGMPQHQHCPLAKRRGDRNPKYHEEQQKDVTLHIIHTYPYILPKTPKRNISRSTNEMLHTDIIVIAPVELFQHLHNIFIT
jgi:hypothetical protein